MSDDEIVSKDRVKRALAEVVDIINQATYFERPQH